MKRPIKLIQGVPSHVTVHEEVKITIEKGMVDAFGDHFREVQHNLA